MQLDEAIERIETFLVDVSEIEGELLDDALRLGIEALKAYKTSRQFSSIHHVPLLPGETT